MDDKRDLKQKQIAKQEKEPLPRKEGNNNQGTGEKKTETLTNKEQENEISRNLEEPLNKKQLEDIQEIGQEIVKVLSKKDPGDILVNARKHAEAILLFIHERAFPTLTLKPKQSTIFELMAALSNHIPKPMKASFRYIQEIGNLAVHAQPKGQQIIKEAKHQFSVECILIEIATWFFKDYLKLEDAKILEKIREIEDQKEKRNILYLKKKNRNLEKEKRELLDKNTNLKWLFVFLIAILLIYFLFLNNNKEQVKQEMVNHFNDYNEIIPVEKDKITKIKSSILKLSQPALKLEEKIQISKKLEKNPLINNPEIKRHLISIYPGFKKFINTTLKVTKNIQTVKYYYQFRQLLQIHNTHFFHHRNDLKKTYKNLITKTFSLESPEVKNYIKEKNFAKVRSILTEGQKTWDLSERNKETKLLKKYGEKEFSLAVISLKKYKSIDSVQSLHSFWITGYFRRILSGELLNTYNKKIFDQNEELLNAHQDTLSHIKNACFCDPGNKKYTDLSKTVHLLFPKPPFDDKLFDLIDNNKIKIMRDKSGIWNLTLVRQNIQFVYIPTGSYFPSNNSKSNKQKALTDFWISKYEIPSNIYNKVIKGTNFPQTLKVFKNDQNTPALVRWSEAQVFCKILNNKYSLLEIKLPSEQQWIKAARGPYDKRKYPWGDSRPIKQANIADLTLFENFELLEKKMDTHNKLISPDFANRNSNDGYAAISPIAEFPESASPFGVLNMCGNVCEWTSNSHKTNDNLKLIKGGSWRHSHQRSTIDYNREYKEKNTLYFHIGFRVILTITNK